MNTINPLDVLLWTFRRSPADVVKLYDALSGVMRLATGGNSLNFGLWNDKCLDPISAQTKMAEYFSGMADLSKAKVTADVGSGLSGPAAVWGRQNPGARLVCIDINRRSLAAAGAGADLVNGSSAQLPLADGAVDRVLALESAQHFQSLERFTAESARVLTPGGIMCMAVPVAGKNYHPARLGSLLLTWSSEHHSAELVRKSAESAGFTITFEDMVGERVYEPLARYYLENQKDLRARIVSEYPRYVESLLHRSILDMKKASERKIIDYLMIKCELPS